MWVGRTPSPPVARWKAVIAAPSAMECLGCASTATGTRNVCPTSWPTRGIRDEPPTSSTARSCSDGTPADRSTRSNASMLTRTDGSIMASSSDRLSRASA
ncbi:MAG TPA: hypothetical protein VIC62_02460 [Nakamurella sp.]